MGSSALVCEKEGVSSFGLLKGSSFPTFPCSNLAGLRALCFLSSWALAKPDRGCPIPCLPLFAKQPVGSMLLCLLSPGAGVRETGQDM